MDENNVQVQAQTQTQESANVIGDNLLTEIRELTRKQVRWQRFSSLCMFAILVVVAVAVFTLMPQAIATLSNINATVDRANESLVEVDAMVAEMTSASKNLNELVDNNEKSLTEAIDKMSNVDYDGLNKAIQDLQGAVSPLSNFFKRFK